jgi:hypothetical protein
VSFLINYKVIAWHRAEIVFCSTTCFDHYFIIISVPFVL